MLCSASLAIMQRELRAVRRTVEAYPTDASLWEHPAGLPNAGGTLVLHICGNLQHFLGAVIGKTGYKRDRDAEFAMRNVSRDVLLTEIDATSRAVERGLTTITDNHMAELYPDQVANRTVSNGDFIVHLAVHLGYHLGQLDYHRRVVTGDATSINALAPKELPVRGAVGT